MKVLEILERTKEKGNTIAKIAKESPVGEKKLRAILKSIGAKPPETGKSGWTYERVDPEDLDRDITYFMESRAASQPKAKASTSKSKSISAESGNDDDYILALIKGKPKAEEEKIYKGIYFEPDIGHFLDSIQHGNKSELINRILRKYLTDNGLL